MATRPQEKTLSEHVLALLRGGNAHMAFGEAVANFPPDAYNSRAPNVTYTPWHLLEHIRRTQRDILSFIKDPHYSEPRWPDDFWPKQDERADEAAWNQTIQGFGDDLAALEALVTNGQIDLLADLPYEPGYTYLRELLLVADHSAYHIGEFAILRQVMGTWPKDRHP